MGRGPRTGVDRWLLDQGVTFRFSTKVTDIDVAVDGERIQATGIHWQSHDEEGVVELGPDDLVLATIGSLTENSDDGRHDRAAKLNRGPAPAWDLWRKLADKHPSIFTTEYSVRTGMEAAYRLLGIERGVPEVFNSTYDIRMLLKATTRLRDGEAVSIPGPKFLSDRLFGKLDATQLGLLLTDFGLIPAHGGTEPRPREDDAVE